MSLSIMGCTEHNGATGNRRQSLEQLKGTRKFTTDSTTFYPGAVSERDRERLEKAINEIIDHLLAAHTESLDKQAVLKEFKTSLVALDMEDSEDKDQVCVYLEKIMDIFQIESSDGLLNDWRYGFDPNEVQH